ncbi:hypothetical protein B0H13DRAFT_2332667 [Mycena leptocephala]|nr:hypothetical protein B0H13DRAFT_2332667 [Mycena leptocephala]
MTSTARSPPKTRFEYVSLPTSHFAHILPLAIALSSPACPKPSFVPSFVCGLKSSMPKVEDVSIWLRWAVDPPRPCECSSSPRSAPRLPDALSPPASAPVPPSLASRSGQPHHPVLPPLPPHPCPGVPLRSCHLMLLAYSVVLFSLLRLVLSPSLFPALARRWGIRKAGKLTRFGEHGYAVVYFAVVGQCIALHAPRSPPFPFLPSFLVPPLFLLPPYSLSLCFPSLPLSVPSSFTFLLVPTPLILLTRSMNFRCILIALATLLAQYTSPASSTLNPFTARLWLDRCCTTSGSFLQPRLLSSSARARSCIDWRPASAWNADAGSVRATSRSPANWWIR